jgi:hypothetical protein
MQLFVSRHMQPVHRYSLCEFHGFKTSNTCIKYYCNHVCNNFNQSIHMCTQDHRKWQTYLRHVIPLMSSEILKIGFAVTCSSTESFIKHAGAYVLVHKHYGLVRPPPPKHTMTPYHPDMLQLSPLKLMPLNKKNTANSAPPPQDGDLPHSSQEKQNALNIRFNDRWTGRGRPTPRSHEVNTSHPWIFLWEIVKNVEKNRKKKSARFTSCTRVN